MNNDNFSSINRNIKYLICAVVFIGVLCLFIISYIIFNQFPKGIVTIDVFIGTCSALIGVLATIIVANHFISIYNFNNKITNIEKKVETIKGIEENLIYTQYEVNKTLAYNSYLENKMLKAIRYELENMSFLIKNNIYFNGNQDKNLKKKLDARLGYISNDLLCFIEKEPHKNNTYNLENAFIEILEEIYKLENIDSYGIKIRLNIIKNVIVKIQQNIKNNKTPIISRDDESQLKSFRKQ